MLQDDIVATVKMALTEDLGGVLDPSLDVTSQLIDENSAERTGLKRFTDSLAIKLKFSGLLKTAIQLNQVNSFSI